MAKIIGLPKLSPTMEEGTLVSWAKKEGDAIDVDDLLAEVETDKATMEFRSFDRGVLLKILVPEGVTLEAEVPVAIIGDEGEDISALLAEVEQGAAAAPAPPVGPDATPDSKAVKASKPSAATTAAKPAEASAPSPEPAEASPPAEASADSGRVLSSPLVRRLARERGIDLSRVDGTGPHGRIIKADIDAYEPGAGTAPAAGDRPPPRVEPASSMRRTIARRLTESKQTVPHYYLTIDTNIAPLMEARKELNAVLEAEGKKASLNDLIIKAAAVALRRVPQVNASWVDKAIHYHQVVDVSVAVSIEDGLLTPVVRDADKKGIAQIADDVRDLATRARDRKLGLEEMTGGTFSISNLGMFGIDEFAAVINPPEAAILAVGTIREEPVAHEGQIILGKRMRFTMSCDHRVVDGATGAKYLAAFKGIIESPLSMLL